MSQNVPTGVNIKTASLLRDSDIKAAYRASRTGGQLLGDECRLGLLYEASYSSVNFDLLLFSLVLLVLLLDLAQHLVLLYHVFFILCLIL